MAKMSKTESLPLPHFFSEEPLVGDPPWAWSDFAMPILRQFPYPASEIRWGKEIGRGVSAFVRHISIGDLNLVAKVFWEPLPDKPDKYYWPQHEVYSVAVLEKVRTCLRRRSYPIVVPKSPRTRWDALRNLYAFSEDGSIKRPFEHLPSSETVAITDETTHTVRCYGWARVDRFKSFAIIYEYIPPGDLDPAILQTQLDFFQYTGFALFGYKEDNWRGQGILVDCGDLYTAVVRRFSKSCYADQPDAKVLLRQRAVQDLYRAGQWDAAEKLSKQQDETIVHRPMAHCELDPFIVTTLRARNILTPEIEQQIPDMIPDMTPKELRHTVDDDAEQESMPEKPNDDAEQVSMREELDGDAEQESMPMELDDDAEQDSMSEELDDNAEQESMPSPERKALEEEREKVVMMIFEEAWHVYEEVNGPCWRDDRIRTLEEQSCNIMYKTIDEVAMWQTWQKGFEDYEDLMRSFHCLFP